MVDGDQLEFKAIFRIRSEPHWTEEFRLAQAEECFAMKYEQRFLACMTGQIRTFSAVVEAVIEEDSEPINS